MNSLNVVLVEPEIPQNTGNISRTCAATGTSLHLIKPLGFELSDRYLKRAGLDYWKYLDLHVYESLDEFFSKNPGDYFFFTTKGRRLYTEAVYPAGCYLFFGKETAGLPETLLRSRLEDCVRLPMLDGIRSLNLSNSVAIAVYEALRQRDFGDLRTQSDYFER